jgi:hypothetical protein
MSQHVGSRLDDLREQDDMLAETAATKRMIDWQTERLE